MFSEKELAYLRTRRLLRLATVEPDGQPDVDAVSFEFDGEYFYIGGRVLQTSRKYKNVAAGNTRVSLIIDDEETHAPRGIKLHGVARIVQRTGSFGTTEYLAIRPTVSWHWGIEGPPVFKNGTFVPPKTIWPPLNPEE
jgi:pyridoxamine 5'-phosphate oxidase family protein